MPISDLWKKPPMDKESGKFLRVVDTIWVVISRINVFLMIVWIVIVVILLVSFSHIKRDVEVTKNTVENSDTFKRHRRL